MTTTEPEGRDIPPNKTSYMVPLYTKLLTSVDWRYIDLYKTIFSVCEQLQHLISKAILLFNCLIRKHIHTVCEQLQIETT